MGGGGEGIRAYKYKGCMNRHIINGDIQGQMWEEARWRLLHNGNDDEHKNCGMVGDPYVTG